MRVFASVLLLLLCLVVPTPAAQHEVHVKVLSTLSQTVGGVGVAPSFGQLGHPISCSQLYPSDVVDVARGLPGSVDQCRIATPSHPYTGTVQNRRVEAMLTTETGQTIVIVVLIQPSYLLRLL